MKDSRMIKSQLGFLLAIFLFFIPSRIVGANELTDINEEIETINITEIIQQEEGISNSEDDSLEEYDNLPDNGTESPTIDKNESIANDDTESEFLSKVKNYLVELGYQVHINSTVNLSVDTLEEAVRKFQTDYGFKITGLSNEETLNALEEVVVMSSQKEDTNTDLENPEDIPKIEIEKVVDVNQQEPEKIEEVREVRPKITSAVRPQIMSISNQKENVVENPFQRGYRHEDTIKLKVNLSILGFHVSDTPTTLYGVDTERQVLAFQKKYGLKETGMADLDTWMKINELLEVPMAIGLYRDDVIPLKQNLDIIGFHVSKNPTNYYGPTTEKMVKAFQKYYGLSVTGVVAAETLSTIESILSSPLQNGKRHADTKVLKANLAMLGFTVPGNGTTLYGTETAEKVREFQSYYDLKINGIGDVVTLNKILSILSTPFQNGQRHNDTKKLKSDLAKLGFRVPGNGTTLYGTDTTKKVREFQSYYHLAVSGIAEEKTFAKISLILSSPLQNGKRHKDTIQLKKELAQIGLQVSMDPTNLYGKTTEKKVKEFQKSYGLKVSGIADPITLKKLADAVTTANKQIKIFIDPGHGGKDSGATGYGLMEKNVVLDISLKAAEILQRDYIGIDVMLSRTTDNFIELEDRAKLANNWGATYFVSIHNNAFNSSTSGFESFIHNGNVSKITKDKQNLIHDYLIKELGVVNRGKKEANFSVLRNTTMPSILLEYLFIDNKSENDKLRKVSYRNWLGEITARAIAYSFNLMKK